MKIEKAEELDEKTFELCQDTLNMLLAFLHRYDISSFIEANRFFRKNPSLYKRVMKRREILEKCNLQEIHLIKEKYIITAICALIANSFFFLLMLSPFVLLVAAFKGMRYLLDRAKNITSELFSIPEREADLLNQICIG
ncbi:MAG: hypothetical protein RQ760_10195 [Sedimentisphaerales bacterium]|nr:hypothetical protein [Sedimentisphaerales bacterium]